MADGDNSTSAGMIVLWVLLGLVIAGVITLIVLAATGTFSSQSSNNGSANGNGNGTSATLNDGKSVNALSHAYDGGHPIDRQANVVFDRVAEHGAHPSLRNCYAPASATYSPEQDLLQGNDALVPPYQQALKQLPAMRSLNLQQEFPGTNIGPLARSGIDAMAPVTLDAETRDSDEDFHARVAQTEGVGVNNIYKRKGDRKGISLINQKSRLVDPTKMLPRVDPSRQSERLVQAGPSIEDIGRRVPQAADIMRLLRASRGASSHCIAKDRPPLYTEGLNAFRPTTLPLGAFDQSGCTIGIAPLEVADLIDYKPNPFLHGSRAAQVPYNYSVGPEI